MKAVSKEEIEEIANLARPIADYIRKNFNPHYSIVVTDESVRVESAELYVPLGD